MTNPHAQALGRMTSPEKAERAHEYFMRVADDAEAYHAYMLVVGKSLEYAEKILGTPLA